MKGSILQCHPHLARPPSCGRSPSCVGGWPGPWPSYAWLAAAQLHPHGLPGPDITAAVGQATWPSYATERASDDVVVVEGLAVMVAFGAGVHGLAAERAWRAVGHGRDGPLTGLPVFMPQADGRGVALPSHIRLPGAVIVRLGRSSGECDSPLAGVPDQALSRRWRNDRPGSGAVSGPIS